MNTLKTYFPFAFQPKADIVALIVNIIVHIIVGALAAVVIGLLASLPLIFGIVIRLLGILVGLYFTVSVILSILDYLKILK